MVKTAFALSDDARLHTMTDIAKGLLAHLSCGGDPVVDLSAVMAPDLSLLQLLESARRHVAAAGGTLALTAPVPPVVAALLDRAGFTAAATPDDLAFWFHGDLPQ